MKLRKSVNFGEVGFELSFQGMMNKNHTLKRKKDNF